MKTIVMLSGGIDSSVSAYLLKDNDIIGVNIKTFDSPKVDDSCDTITKKCCTPKDTMDAREICMHIGIPFNVIKMEDDFKKNVIDNFIDEYRNGRTPSPCVRCNTHVKIGLVHSKLSKMFGDIKIATGHYAKVIKVDDRYTIGRSSFADKDQSYFLWDLSQDIIKDLIFPISDLTKDEVRNIGRNAGLITADKPESQDICFIPGDYRDFLKKHIDFTPGNFLLNNDIIGTHSGKENFTVGQRKGLGVSWKKPLYVKKINPNGDIILTEDDGKGIDSIEINNLNLLSVDGLKDGDTFLIQTRLRSKLINAHWNDGKIIVDDYLQFVSPGQSLVAYDKTNSYIVFGGVII